MPKEEMSFEEAWRAYRSDPAAFFDNILKSRFSERELISPHWTQMQTTYHYNLLENAIIDLLIATNCNPEFLHLLDVGSGTGYWIDFYLRVVECQKVTGIDFAPTTVKRLSELYKDEDKVEILLADISAQDLNLQGPFDLINAIGVIFHIVDDDKWLQAIDNMIALAHDRTLVIVGGEFGDKTENRGVMRRVRALGVWEDVLNDRDCEILQVRRFDWFSGADRGGITDNLLVFKRKR